MGAKQVEHDSRNRVLPAMGEDSRAKRLFLFGEITQKQAKHTHQNGALAALIEMARAKQGRGQAHGYKNIFGPERKLALQVSPINNLFTDSSGHGNKNPDK